MNPQDAVFFPPLAGGFLDPGTTANSKVAGATRGCVVTHVSAGVWNGVPNEPLIRGKVRLWVTPSQNFPEGQCFINLVNEDLFVITSYGLGVGAGPALTATPADMVVSFGIDGIPDR